MIEHSPELDKLGAALAKAQAIVKNAKKDSANPFFKSSYADLASVWEACREALTSNGLSVVQFPGFENGYATIATMLLHNSGQWLQATAGAPIAKQDAQGVGSALTYLRRYALAAVASVSPDDDDGNAATERGRTTTATKGESQRSAARATSAPAAPPTPLRAPDTTPLSQKPQALERKDPDPLKGEDADPMTWPFGADRGRTLSSFDSEALLAKRSWLVKKSRRPDEFVELLDAIDTEMSTRGGL